MPDLSHSQAQNKFKIIKGLSKLLEKALILYELATDEETPAAIKAIAIAALIYLICPMDAIPDITPFTGYTDDLVVLTAALKSLKGAIKSKHRRKAKQRMNNI